MITIKVKESNPITQKFYDNLLNSLQFHQLTCPSCDHASCLHPHCYYIRYIKQDGCKSPVKICRVICHNCKSTHAILPSSIVPYSQLPLTDHAAAAESYLGKGPTSAVLMKDNQLDHSSLRYSVKQFRRYWCQRILSYLLSIYPLDELVTSCFEHFGRQFMQNKCTPNILFVNTT